MDSEKIAENSGKHKRKYKFSESAVCMTTCDFNRSFVHEYHLPFATVFSCAGSYKTIYKRKQTSSILKWEKLEMIIGKLEVKILLKKKKKRWRWLKNYQLQTFFISYLNSKTNLKKLSFVFIENFIASIFRNNSNFQNIIFSIFQKTSVFDL